MLGLLLLQACQRGIPGPLEPPVRQGMAYPQARRMLLARGWRPHQRESTQGCGETLPDQRCSLFPELQACSSTGLGLCRFEWMSPEGGKLVVITAGGDPRGDAGEVHDWFPGR